MIIFFLILLGLFSAIVFTENEVGRNFRVALRSVLENELIEVDGWPQSQTFDASYILGGNPRAQRYKFHVVSKIYDQNICRKIYMLSHKGKMGYDANLKRNQTVDEWSFLKMKRLGVPSSAVMTLSMERGMFGTMTEASNVAELVSQNNYMSLLLVAAPYHTQRVRLSYGHFLKDKEIEIIILGSGEPVYLRGLILEWLKLKAYEILFKLY